MMRPTLLVGLLAMLPLRAEPVSGIVRQLHGLPAVGAALRLQRIDDAARAAVAVSADSRGQFSADLPPGRYVAIVSGAWADTRRTFTVAAGLPERLDLGVDWPWSVPPTAQGRLMVVDGAGRPLPGMPVRIVAQGHVEPVPTDWLGVGQRRAVSPVGEGHWWVFERRATTDAAGNCELRLPAGALTIGVFAGEARLVDGVLAVPGGQLPDFRLVCARRLSATVTRPAATVEVAPMVTGQGVSLSGVVRDERGQPWANCAARLDASWCEHGEQVDQWRQRSWVVLTDADGRYRLAEPDLPAVAVAMVLRVADGITQRRSEVALRPGERLELDWQVRRPTEWTPRLVRPGGQPLAGALVGDGEAMAWTDADGRVRLLGDGAHALSVRAAGAANAFVDFAPGESETLVVPFEAGHVLVGRVLGLESAERPLALSAFVWLDEQHTSAVGATTVALAADGGFALGGLRAGSAFLLEAGRLPRKDAPILLPCADTIQVTWPAAADDRLSEYVRGPHNRPQAGVTVMLTDRDALGWGTVSDENGYYILPWPDTARGTLVAAAPGLPAGPALRLPADGDRRAIHLPSAWLEAEVDGLPDTCHASAEIVTSSAQSLPATGPPELSTMPQTPVPGLVDGRVVIRDRRFELSGAPTSGRLLIELRRDLARGTSSYAWWWLGSRTLAAGANHWRLALPAERAELTVHLPERGLACQRVGITDAATGELLGLAWPGGERSITWPALPARDVLVVAPGGSGSAGPAQLLTLVPGERQELRLASVSGTVVEGKLPPDGAPRQLALRGRGVWAETVSRNGRYSFQEVPPGQYELWYQTGRGWDKREVTVRDERLTVDPTDPPAAR